MLYLFDEYVAEYPARAVAGLNYFLDSPKNLHEMSAEEISEVYNNAPEITEKTAAAHKSAIRLYLKWLLSRGIKCDPTVVQRVECNLSNKKFLIFSTEDLAYYQEILKDYLTATAENGGKKNKSSDSADDPRLWNTVFLWADRGRNRYAEIRRCAARRG